MDLGQAIKTLRKMKGPSPMRRILKSWEFWAFIACTLLVAVCEALDGNWICVIWVIIAASFNFFADLFKEYSDDFMELSADLIEERDTMRDALRERKTPRSQNFRPRS